MTGFPVNTAGSIAMRAFQAIAELRVLEEDARAPSDLPDAALATQPVARSSRPHLPRSGGTPCVFESRAISKGWVSRKLPYDLAKT